MYGLFAALLVARTPASTQGHCQAKQAQEDAAGEMTILLSTLENLVQRTADTCHIATCAEPTLKGEDEIQGGPGLETLGGAAMRTNSAPAKVDTTETHNAGVHCIVVDSDPTTEQGRSGNFGSVSARICLQARAQVMVETTQWGLWALEDAIGSGVIPCEHPSSA